MIPMTPPANKKMTVNSKKGVPVIAVAVSVTQARILVNAAVRSDRKAAMKETSYQFNSGTGYAP